eukprot:51921-Rhodomonas_salina.1
MNAVATILQDCTFPLEQTIHRVALFLRLMLLLYNVCCWLTMLALPGDRPADEPSGSVPDSRGVQPAATAVSDAVREPGQVCAEQEDPDRRGPAGRGRPHALRLVPDQPPKVIPHGPLVHHGRP